jgi:pyruvate/2-oxoacid:ferredoxin oxidoreductase alpha subunit
MLSHSMAPFEVLDYETVNKFLPERQLSWCLHPSMGRSTFGSVTPALEYSQFRAKLAEDIVAALAAYRKRSAELDDLTGHQSGGFFRSYRTEGAKYFVLSMGSMAVEAELAVDRLREQGIAAPGCG